jgi:hypothetical protein
MSADTFDRTDEIAVLRARVSALLERIVALEQNEERLQDTIEMQRHQIDVLEDVLAGS